MVEILTMPRFASEVQFYTVRGRGPEDWIPLGPATPNALVQGSLVQMVRMLSGKSATPINGMYLEFDNNASPGVVSTPPSIVYGDTGYYAGLSTAPARDYLRVPMIAATTATALAGPSAGVEAVLNFFAQVTGTAGVNGKPYDTAHNSRLFGAALVSMPDFADPSKDVVFARTYKSGGAQAPKLASGQTGFRWSYTLQP